MKIFKTIKEIKYIKDESNDSKPLVIGSGGFSKVKLIYHNSNPSKVYALKKLFKKDD
jgi:hypothetical protein